MTGASSSRLPDRTARAFLCPHCNAFSAQQWNALGYYVHSAGGEWPVGGGWSFHLLREGSLGEDFLDEDASERQEHERTRYWVDGAAWASSRCDACEMVAIWRDERMVHPTQKGAPQAHVDMPVSAAELYEEARAVLPISRRAGTAMARATLERLLRELDTEAPRGAKLDQRIQRVASRVSSGLAGILDVIRHAGNKSLHVSEELDDVLVLVLDEKETEVVDLLLSAINELVDELVTKPNRHQDLIGRLPQAVRDSMEQRGAKKTSGPIEA